MKGLKFILFFIFACSLPQTLLGQEKDSDSSITGQLFIRNNVYSMASGDLMQSINVALSGRDVALIADSDTLRTVTDSQNAFFTFSGISSKRVTLMVENPGYEVVPICATFDLMPGENVIVIPCHRTSGQSNPTMRDDAVIVTEDGDSWVYHLASDSVIKDLVFEKLCPLPGVDFNKRKNAVYISGETIHRTSTDGVYIFGLNP